MKKVIIIFAGVTLALTGCKMQTDGLASAGVDDVYYNPKTDRKPKAAPQPAQESVQPADPNAGKIAARPEDANNPYYRDPEFNYDDYYDNAYAARIRRFNNPIYGTGYYDTYNTNSYFYNGNPACYGTSIYSGYNMSGYNMGYGYNNGWGYYSPSASFWNAYYNPYYNGFGYGNGWSTGWAMNYGYDPYGGYNNWGYSYNPYGYGYNPSWSYSPYGYSPYGYGMGYSFNNPMTYYNPYDYNSYGNYGPRGNGTGGNSSTRSPVPKPHHIVVNNSGAEDNSAAPYSTQRFSQVALPRDHFTKVQAVKSPVNTAPVIIRGNEGPVRGGTSAATSSGGNGVYNGGVRPSYNPPANSSNGGNAVYTKPQQPASNSNSGESRPRRRMLGGGSEGNTGSGSSGNTNWNSGGVKNVNTGGGGTNKSGGSSGGGTFRPRK